MCYSWSPHAFPPVFRMTTSMKDVPALTNLLLDEFSVFRDLEIEEYQSIATAVDQRTYQDGEALFEAGELSRELYGIINGRVEILRSDESGRDRRLAILEPHAVLGELGFVLGEPRTATVRAIERLDVWCLNGRMFDALAEAHSEAARNIESNIIRMMAQRLSDTNKQLIKLMKGKEGEYHVDDDDDIEDQLMRRWTV